MARKRHFQVQLETFIINPSSGKNIIESVKPVSSSDVQYPKDGLNLFYGKRFASEALSFAAREARSNGDLLVPVIITMSAWRPESANHWFDTWEDKTVFDMRRIKDKTHESKIQSLWLKYMGEDGMTPEAIRSADCWRHLQYIERYPQYIDRLRKEKEFRHIDVFIWGSQENGKQIARATVYNTKNVVSIRPVSAEPLQVEMPRGFAKAA